MADYVLNLASQTNKMGHHCVALSLNDSGTGVVVCQEYGGVRILRLPQAMGWDRRIEHAQQWLTEAGAEWLSVQMVCYGFQKKGVVVGLGDRLRRLVKGRRVHIMFHELWIGLATGSSFKERLVGAVQRRFILNAIKGCRPLVIHTNNKVYSHVLARCGLNARVLPLFSNVPIISTSESRWLISQISPIGLIERSSLWIFVLFGRLHPEWTATPLLDYLLEFAADTNRKIALTAIGDMGDLGRRLWARTECQFSGRIIFKSLGMHSARRVSEVLNCADFGIAASPRMLIEKSSAAATMVDHGLPVIVSRNDQRFDGIYAPMTSPRFLSVDDTLVKRLKRAQRNDPRSRLPEVAAQFLHDLANATGQSKAAGGG